MINFKVLVLIFTLMFLTYFGVANNHPNFHTPTNPLVGLHSPILIFSLKQHQTLWWKEFNYSRNSPAPLCPPSLNGFLYVPIYLINYRYWTITGVFWKTKDKTADLRNIMIIKPNNLWQERISTNRTRITVLLPFVKQRWSATYHQSIQLLVSSWLWATMFPHFAAQRKRGILKEPLPLIPNADENTSPPPLHPCNIFGELIVEKLEKAQVWWDLCSFPQVSSVSLK